MIISKRNKRFPIFAQLSRLPCYYSCLLVYNKTPHRTSWLQKSGGSLLKTRKNFFA